MGLREAVVASPRVVPRGKVAALWVHEGLSQHVLSTSAINSPCFCQAAAGKEHSSLGLEEAVYGGAELMG